MLLFIAAIEDDLIRSKLEVIYEKYSGSMYNRAYYILKNVEDAEDAVSASIERIYKNIDKVGDPLSLKTKGLALIITEHCAIDIYRKRKRKLQNETVLEEDSVFSVSDEIVYEGENAITAQIFKLNEKYRNILILKYVQGYDYSTIAKMLNISETNARKIGQRAKAKLEELCREQGLL